MFSKVSSALVAATMVSTAASAQQVLHYVSRPDKFDADVIDWLCKAPHSSANGPTEWRMHVYDFCANMKPLKQAQQEGHTRCDADFNDQKAGNDVRRQIQKWTEAQFRAAETDAEREKITCKRGVTVEFTGKASELARRYFPTGLTIGLSVPPPKP